MSDPHLAAVAAYIERVEQLVKDDQLAGADALAVLAADLLGMSLRPHVHPDTADALLSMASEYASQRYAIVNAAALLARNPIPDSPDGPVEFR